MALNGRQEEVLRWVGDGCPDRAWPNQTHKHTARALANRGLLRVSRRGGVWSAELTDLGRAWLEAGKNGSAEPPTAMATSQRRRQPTQPVADGDIGPGELFRETPPQLADHTVVVALAGNPSLLPVSEGQRARALAVVSSIVAGAVSRGWSAVVRPEGRPGLVLSAGQESLELVVSEEFERGEVFATQALEAAKYPWQRVRPEVRQVPSGRLRVEVVSEYRWQRAPFWADRKRWVLESRLELMFKALEGRFAEAAAARHAREDVRRRRRALWEEARPRAREEYVRRLNAQRLAEQAEAFGQAESLRRYVLALEAHAETHGDPDVAEWVRFAKQEADRLDPLKTADLRLVDPVDVRAHELDAFMPAGMSYQRPPDEAP